MTAAATTAATTTTNSSSNSLLLNHDSHNNNNNYEQHLNDEQQHNQNHNMLNEDMVQEWLDANKSWFQLYAIENLDANTVEKWLRTQGKRVCKCKNPSAETMMSNSFGDNMSSLGVSNVAAATAAAAARGKRNSIGFIPVIDDITGKDLLGISENAMNEIKRKNTTSPNLQEIPSSNGPKSLATTTAAASSSSSSCTSNSSCIIHNRKSWYLAQDKSSIIHENGPGNSVKKFSFVYEEEATASDDNEDDASNESESSAKSGGEEKSPTSEENPNLKMVNTSAPQKIIWTPGGVSMTTSTKGSNKKPPGSGGNPIRKYHSFHTGSDHHHYHHHYYQSSSLNALKFLIKSKIKLPHSFANSSNMVNPQASSSTMTSMSEKIKIRYDDNNNRIPMGRQSLTNNINLVNTNHQHHHHRFAMANSTADVKLLLESIKDIAYELDLKRLSDKIVANVRALVNADKASLFFVCQNRRQLAAFKFDAHTGIPNPARYLAKSGGSGTSSSSYGSGYQRQQSSGSSASPLDFEFEIPFENTILGAVALSGNSINISNVTKDARYDTSMDKLTGYQVKSLLCMPIKNVNKEVIAVVQAVNKTDPFHAHNDSSRAICFDDNDVRILNDYLQLCAISISNSQLFDFYIYECERNRSLIEVLHDLFEQQTNLDTILFRIMQRAQTLLKCQRCSILLNLNHNDGNESAAASASSSSSSSAAAPSIDERVTRKAFDLFQSGNKPGQRRHSVEDDDGSKISRELADYVIQTGEKINLADAYSDPRFDPLVDTVWRFKTKGILCMPIRDRDGAIIGCANIANRLDEQPFDEADEELFEAFCIFCGLAINNTLIYNKLEKSMAEKVVALEVLSYHATCSKSELAAFLKKYAASITDAKETTPIFKIPSMTSSNNNINNNNNNDGLPLTNSSHNLLPLSASGATSNAVVPLSNKGSSSASNDDDSLITRLSRSDSCLVSYLFNDFSLENDEMIVASYEMFKRSGLMRSFHIEKQTLFQWLLTVKKNYRNVEYHNWRHAFNVCQNMFAIFENSIISNYLQDIEKLALLVGCLCHDLDHRGTNNMFQVESHSALCQLYGTTGVLEKHHFNHCVMILNTAGHNIFSNIKPRTYGLLMSYIKEAILATDLAEHFMIMGSFQEAVDNKDVYWNEEPYCSLLRKNLMTFCDLAAVAKPWPIHKKVVNLVTKEFFAQGDRERLELNKEPNEMMDARRYHELPRLQIAWIDNVCLPLYGSFANICNSFNGHLTRINENRLNWSSLNEKLKNSDTTILDEVD